MAAPGFAPDLDFPQLEGQLRLRLGSALDARFAELQAEFGELLDRRALLCLIAEAEGLLPHDATPAPAAERAPEVAELRGVLERLSATRTFARKDGTTGFVCDIEVRTAERLQRVVLWDEPVRAAQSLLGQRVRVLALLERQRAGEPELHSTRRTQVERDG